MHVVHVVRVYHVSLEGVFVEEGTGTERAGGAAVQDAVPPAWGRKSCTDDSCNRDKLPVTGPHYAVATLLLPSLLQLSRPLICKELVLQTGASRSSHPSGVLKGRCVLVVSFKLLMKSSLLLLLVTSIRISDPSLKAGKTMRRALLLLGRGRQCVVHYSADSD